MKAKDNTNWHGFLVLGIDKIAESVTKFWIRIKRRIDHIGVLQTPISPHLNRPMYLSLLFSFTGNRPFSCSVCGKRFARKNNLKEHKTIHRKDANAEELGKIVCPICGERCLYNSRLGRHIIVKHGNIGKSLISLKSVKLHRIEQSSNFFRQSHHTLCSGAKFYFYIFLIAALWNCSSEM